MPLLEDLPDGFALPTRTEVRDKFQQNVALRQPGAPTGEGSQAFVDGSVIADTVMPLYANAGSIARGGSLSDMTREQLKAECKALGIPEELPASAATGFVLITASTGGVFISEARFLKDEQRNVTFRCAYARQYYNGEAVPIIGVDTGPNTNVPAGTKLKWQNPPAGLGLIATVQEDADGNGTTGGRDVESDDDIRRRIETRSADPPAGGNVASVRNLVKKGGKQIGIAVEEAFVYPAFNASGHYAYVFTLRPSTPGVSRIPDATQIALMRAFIHRELPEDDGIFAAEILEEETALRIGVRWASGADGWMDAVQWPAEASDWDVMTATSATTFTVRAAAGIVTDIPQVGQTIAFYDADDKAFVKKRILTATNVSGGGESRYTLTIDETNSASDVNYLPVVGEAFCPFSESLSLLVSPILKAADVVGPGEMVAAPFDEGTRQRRIPEDPVEWQSDFDHDLIDEAEDLEQVHDMSVISPVLPLAVSVGVPGVSANMLKLTSILAFPI